jgi:Xaa-Pro aminopeptidase
MESRLNRLRAKFDGAGIDALYLENRYNVRYLTGFTGSTAVLVVTPDGGRLFVDPRYWVQAAQQAEGVEIVECGAGMSKEVLEAVRGMGIPRLGFEAGDMTVARRDALAEALPDSALIGTTGLLEDLRLVKDAEEIAVTKRACALVDAMFDSILGLLKPGTLERDIALELEYRMRKSGAERIGFDSIIAAGENGAKPHAEPSERPLRHGDLVTMDFGARVDGYNADITRTVAIGAALSKQREVYDVTLRAQEAAAAALMPGVSYVGADKVARDIIADAGYGEYFGHGLGHSLGLEVHDGARLSPAAPEGTVRAGEIWTIEPGIYIPDWGGVRIEDDVLVTDAGPEILTHAPKELLVL